MQGILDFFVVFLFKLYAEIECNNCRENRQELLPRNVTSDGQNRENCSQGQRDD